MTRRMTRPRHRQPELPLASSPGDVERPQRRLRLRRQYLYEIEFHDPDPSDELLAPLMLPRSSVIDRRLDPRLLRAIEAAADGWVIERY